MPGVGYRFAAAWRMRRLGRKWYALFELAIELWEVSRRLSVMAYRGNRMVTARMNDRPSYWSRVAEANGEASEQRATVATSAGLLYTTTMCRRSPHCIVVTSAMLGPMRVILFQCDSSTMEMRARRLLRNDPTSRVRGLSCSSGDMAHHCRSIRATLDDVRHA